MSLTYSVAIRTLGTGGEKFERELRSLFAQTVPPEKVVVYIAEGYPRLESSVGTEQYVWVKKGMMAQRILPYDEITSDCILMLDDDVLLAPDSASKLLSALEDNAAVCVGADVFHNQDMPFKAKLYAAAVNWVLPHRDKRWAFKLRPSGSFSYQLRPRPGFCPSHTCGGPVVLFRKTSFAALRYEDELWLDNFGFAYNEDGLASYKVYANGGRLGVLYGSGCENLDGGTASATFRKSTERVYTKTKACFMIWWRSCYKTGADSAATRLRAATAFSLKTLWMLIIYLAVSIIRLSPTLTIQFCKGLRDGWKEVHSIDFMNLGPFCFDALKGAPRD